MYSVYFFRKRVSKVKKLKGKIAKLTELLMIFA